MTTATETITNTGTGYDGNADDLAQRINDAHRAGLVVHVNGRKVRTYVPSSGTPANVFANGTLSVTVEGRTARVGTIYAKVGQSIAIQIGW